MVSFKISPKVQFSQLWKPGSEGLHGHAHVVCPWPKAGDFQVNKLKPGLGHLQQHASGAFLDRTKLKAKPSDWLNQSFWEICGSER